MPKKKATSRKGRKRKLARDDKEEADVSPPKKKQKTKKQKAKKQKAEKDEWQPPTMPGMEGSPHVENPIVVLGKWIYDGCSTVDDMINALKGQIEYLEGMKDHGWNTIEDNNGHYLTVLNEDEPRYPQYDDEEWF